MVGYQLLDWKRRIGRAVGFSISTGFCHHSNLRLFIALTIALQEMMKQDTSRIISYQELSLMSKVFNTDLEIHQKRRFLGKNPHRKWWRRRKIDEGHEQSSKEKQTLLDDFLGRFLHSELLHRFCVI